MIKDPKSLNEETPNQPIIFKAEYGAKILDRHFYLED